MKLPTQVALVRPALSMTVLLTLVTGLMYPALVTAVAKSVFPAQAEGSLERVDGRIAGSRLIGRACSEAGEFWGRPSSTGGGPYKASSSSGSNLGPTNPALAQAVRERVQALRAADPGNESPIPVDLVTSSASGLDPDISPAAAHFQVRRVALATRQSEASLHRLVDQMVVPRLAGVLGEPHVNVAALNQALRRMSAPAAHEE